MSNPLFIARPLFTLVTLMVGIFCTYVFEYFNSSLMPVVVPNIEQELPLRISACELGEPSGKFVGKQISVEATIWHVLWSNKNGSEDFIIVDPLPSGCSDHSDPFLATELDLHQYFGPNANLETRLGAFTKEVDVRIIGTVRRSEKQDNLVFYKIVPTEIILISPWRKFTPHGAA